MAEDILQKIIEKARKYAIDPAIVYGVCMAESSLNPKATKREDNYRYLLTPELFAKRLRIPVVIEIWEQKKSYGIMQIMGGVLREHGYQKRIPCILNDIDAQFDYSCRHLSNKIRRYGIDYGILSYNSGSPKKAKDGGFLPVEEQPNYYYLRRVKNFAKDWPNGF